MSPSAEKKSKQVEAPVPIVVEEGALVVVEPKKKKKVSGEGAKRKKIGITFIQGSRVGMLTKERRFKRVGTNVNACIAAAVDYVLQEIVEASCTNTINAKRSTVNSRDIMLAVRGDEDLQELFSHIAFFDSGTPVHFEKCALTTVQLERATKAAKAAKKEKAALALENAKS